MARALLPRFGPCEGVGREASFTGGMSKYGQIQLWHIFISKLTHRHRGSKVKKISSFHRGEEQTFK